MSTEAEVEIVAIIVGILSALVAAVWAMLVLRVRDLEEKTISRELFQVHRDHIDERLDKQDTALASNTAATAKALGILERWERRTSPPPRPYDR